MDRNNTKSISILKVLESALSKELKKTNKGFQFDMNL